MHTRLAALNARLTFRAYCGTVIIYGETKYRDEVSGLRNQAALLIRKARRNGGIVNLLNPGETWEFETPEDAAMVSGHDGILRLMVPERGMDGETEDDDEYDDENDEEDESDGMRDDEDVGDCIADDDEYPLQP